MTYTQERIELGEKALAAIAEHILTVPDEQWNIRVWNHDTDCGTVGCAIGHSFDLPEVRSAGLEACFDVRDTLPVFSGHEGFFAVAEAFGLTFIETKRLFSYEGYRSNPTQAEVSDRIKEFLAQRRATA